MNIIRFSQTTGTFYPYDIDYKNVPADVIDVPLAQFKLAMSRKPGETFTIENAAAVIHAAPAIDVAPAMRAKRTELLAATDYLMLPGYPITGLQTSELMDYRQALRDVAEQPGFPDTIAWPTKPEFVK